MCIRDSAATGNGEYNGTYVTPRKGEYRMDVEMGLRGGLRGTYWNNRWLMGDAAVSRVDRTVDFLLDGRVTPTGRGSVSARWGGFVSLTVPGHSGRGGGGPRHDVSGSRAILGSLER